MISLVVLIILTLLARLGGLFWTPLDTWQESARVGLAGMFLFTGVSHFTAMRADFIRMVPPVFPAPGVMVTVSGLCEIAGAIGLLVPAVRLYAGLGLIALLVALLPANIHAAQQGVPLNGRDATPLGLRIPMQLLYMATTIWVAL